MGAAAFDKEISMTNGGTTLSRRRLGAAAALGVIAIALGAAPAAAQAIATAPAEVAPRAAAGSPSENLTVNLMRLLVRRGIIDQASSDALITEAERETAEARAGGATQAAAPAAPPAMAAAAPPTTLADGLPPPAPGSVRIPYVPQVVRDEIKEEVIAQAKAENWALPNAIPEWTKRITISGDVRLRYEDDLYSKSNANDVINFAQLNLQGPVDVNPNTNPGGVPILDTTQNRDNQLFLRARLDIMANPTDFVTADIRLASGTTNTPVSTSQLLGGGLVKKDIWLDRAYLDIHPMEGIGAAFGRMPNPFFSTDLVYDTDLNFDGAAAYAAWPVSPVHGLKLFGTAGAFLTGYADYNFPDNLTSNLKSGTQAKWLFGYQGGAIWKTSSFSWKTAVAYYDFANAQGRLSSPCALFTGITQCSTDDTAPGFMQKGNTLFLLRDITPNPTALSGATPLPELVGLSFPFRVLDVTSTFDLPAFGKHLELTGDFARNLAYNAASVCRFGEAGEPVNNVVAPVAADTDVCAGETGPNAPQFRSGPNAFMLRASFGDPEPWHFGQWNVVAGYKHLDPDSVVDAYTDADFHFGGTNAKGYFVEVMAGLWPGSNVQLRWFSSDQVYGAPLSIDVLQVDLNARF
jgi:Putative porin